MVEWEPIMGTLPPLSQEAWQETFQKYQQSPEFQKKNFHMDVHQFKSIFWFEYSHRLLGRFIGIVFLIPFLFFLVTRRFEKRMIPQLITMFILGGLQGVLGWYMVKSGLVDIPDVSQYRLTAHLGAALVIYAYMFWFALGLLYPKQHDQQNTEKSAGLKKFGLGLSLLIFITALSGGFVAGLDAGFAYNTFPLMDGHLVPEAYIYLQPAWLNVFENIAAVQFNHRLLAITTLLCIIIFWLKARTQQLPSRIRIGTHLLLLTGLAQVTLGISTLLLHVPIPLASAHQGGALVLFTIALYISHGISHGLRGEKVG
jgi:cytochrome c oxidase assembly protein subunit 15